MLSYFSLFKESIQSHQAIKELSASFSWLIFLRHSTKNLVQALVQSCLHLKEQEQNSAQISQFSGSLGWVLELSLSVCSQVSIYEIDKRDCRKFCTTGIDGAMTIWDFKVKMCFYYHVCELTGVVEVFLGFLVGLFFFYLQYQFLGLSPKPGFSSSRKSRLEYSKPLVQSIRRTDPRICIKADAVC